MIKPNIHVRTAYSKTLSGRVQLSATTFAFKSIIKRQFILQNFLIHTTLGLWINKLISYLLVITVHNGGICVLENDEIIARRCSTPSCNAAILAGNFLPLMHCTALLVTSLNTLAETCAASKFVPHICPAPEDGHKQLKSGFQRNSNSIKTKDI